MRQVYDPAKLFCFACGEQSAGWDFCCRCLFAGTAHRYQGAAVAFGLMGMAEAIRECRSFCRCKDFYGQRYTDECYLHGEKSALYEMMERMSARDRGDER